VGGCAGGVARPRRRGGVCAVTQGCPGMSGIVAAASYVPRYRLSGAEIARSFRRDGGNGQRSLAGPDEDALTLAIEAARRLPVGVLDQVTSVVFCSTTAPYAVK